MRHAMKNPALLYLFICCICCVSFCRAQKEHQFINGLKGDVKTVKAVTKRIFLLKDSANGERFGRIDDNGTQYAEFDRKGRFTKWQVYLTEWVKDGELLTEEHFCRYDEDGTLRQDSVYMHRTKIYYNYMFIYNKKKTSLQKWRFTNNTAVAGKFLCSESFFRKGRLYKTTDFINNVTILYNERGDFLQSTPFGATMPDELSVYDASGREIFYKYRTGSDNVHENETYTYDTAGRVLRYIYSSNVVGKNYKEVSDYSQDGKLLSMHTYDLKDSLQEQDIYTYTGSGDERKTYDKDGMLISMATNTYDDKGNLLEQVHKNNFIGDYHHTDIATYEYDAMNNWTKKSWRDGHGYMYVTTRQITYY